jgi:hypothetical protein
MLTSKMGVMHSPMPVRSFKRTFDAYYSFCHPERSEESLIH